MGVGDGDIVQVLSTRAAPGSLPPQRAWAGHARTTQQEETGSVGEHKLKEQQQLKKQQPTEWEQKRDRLKTLWVVVVLTFWVSCGIQLVVYLLKGTVHNCNNNYYCPAVNSHSCYSG